MAYFPINLAGGTYKHKDLSLTAQRTINFMPQRQDAGNAKSPYILESFYGLKPFASASGKNRGEFEHGGVLYKLNGTTLSSVDSSGVFTTLGTIPGSGRAVFDGLSDTLIIVADGVAYTWDGSTFTTATDTDFESPYTVTVLNSQAIYDGDGGRFGTSGVGTPLNIDGLDYATAESKSDFLLRPYAYGSIVYMFGSKAIEQWWNSGERNPPFDKVQGGLINIGLGAVHSLAQDDQGLYFLGDDNQAYYMAGGVPTPLLPDVLVRAVSGFAIRSDAKGWTMQVDGQWFYVLKFTDGDSTFIYPKGGEWFELSSGLKGKRYRGDGYVFCYGKHLISTENGDILELDINTFKDDGNTIRRVRTLSPIHSGLLGQPGKELEIGYFKLIGKTGTGLLTGQGSAPQVVLQYSPDGENFSTEIVGSVGKMGQMTEIIFDIGEAYENWIFRLISTDPVYSSWHGAAIDAELCI